MEEYIIPLKGLKAGKQEFQFLVDKTFFECFDDSDISNSEVDVSATANKSSQTIEMHFKLHGTVHVLCDRCLDEMDLEINGNYNLYLKFGEEFNEVDDEVIIVPREEGFFDLSTFVYEFIKLSIPISKVHQEGKCNPEMLSHLVGEIKEEDKEDIDPRWEALKKLGNNN